MPLNKVKPDSKRCKFCGDIFYRKDFKKVFNQMKTCGKPQCKKLLQKEWTYRNKCMDCGINIVYSAKRCNVCSAMGKNNPFYGQTHTEETKKKLNLFKMGDESYMKGKKHTKESKEKNRDKHIGKKLSKKTIKKILRRRYMSSLEIKMNEIILKNKLPYIFVGNGKFFIERKCPDFINVNGDKIAIEVYYRRHKELFGQAKDGIESWKLVRQLLFNKYGWLIEFFDETQVNEKEVLERLQQPIRTAQMED